MRFLRVEFNCKYDYFEKMYLFQMFQHINVATTAIFDNQVQRYVKTQTGNVLTCMLVRHSSLL